MKFIKACPFRLPVALGVVLLILIARSSRISDPSWEQPTMGTLCHITISGSIPKSKLETLREKVDAELLDVNQRMSTWQSDTEISQFNHFQGVELFLQTCGRDFSVSADFGGEAVDAELFETHGEL